MPNPTPKPTAEERLDRIDAAVERIEEREKERASLDGYVRLMHRRQAFEEASEAVRAACHCEDGYTSRHGFECEYCRKSMDAIRALAKAEEQADGP